VLAFLTELVMRVPLSPFTMAPSRRINLLFEVEYRVESYTNLSFCLFRLRTISFLLQQAHQDGFR
jgi:hypothetical protein